MPSAAAAPAAAAAVAAPDGDQAAAPAPANPIFGLLRMLAIWWLFRSFFSGGGGGGGKGGSPGKQSTSQLARSDYFLPLMQRATPVDVAMVLSEKKVLSPGWLEFGESERPSDAARVVWSQAGVPLATAAESKVTVAYTPSEVRTVLLFFPQWLRRRTTALFLRRVQEKQTGSDSKEKGKRREIDCIEKND